MTNGTSNFFYFVLSDIFAILLNLRMSDFCAYVIFSCTYAVFINLTPEIGMELCTFSRQSIVL